jgi:hypothetical protein
MKHITDFAPLAPYPMKDACNLVTTNGTQVLTMPDGTVIPHQIWSRVYTGVDGPPYAIVKLYVQPKDITELKP